MERVVSETPDISTFGLAEIVFGAQRHGSVVGMGSGIRPTHFQEDQRKGSNTQKVNQLLTEENEKLRTQVHELQTRQETSEAREQMMQSRLEASERREQEMKSRQEESERQIAFILSNM